MSEIQRLRTLKRELGRAELWFEESDILKGIEILLTSLLEDKIAELEDIYE